MAKSKETIEKLNDPAAAPAALADAFADAASQGAKASLIADIRAAVDPRGVNAMALLKLIELIESEV